MPLQANPLKIVARLRKLEKQLPQVQQECQAVLAEKQVSFMSYTREEDGKLPLKPGRGADSSPFSMLSPANRGFCASPVTAVALE